MTVAATLALVVIWALLLRPELLGGPAAYVIVSGKSMEPVLHDGDLVVALKKRSYRVGDVIAYRIPEGDPGAGSLVIHRVIGGSASAGYVTQGDNREGRDLWEPTARDVVGNMLVRVPRAGLLLAFVQTPLGIAIFAGLATFLFASGLAERRAPWTRRHRYSVPAPRAVTRRSARPSARPGRSREGARPPTAPPLVPTTAEPSHPSDGASPAP